MLADFIFESKEAVEKELKSAFDKFEESLLKPTTTTYEWKQRKIDIGTILTNA